VSYPGLRELQRVLNVFHEYSVAIAVDIQVVSSVFSATLRFGLPSQLRLLIKAFFLRNELTDSCLNG
jgi:hypothetical protein